MKQFREEGRPLLEQALLQLKARGAEAVHLHVDADVYDPAIAPANSYAVKGGLFHNDVNLAIICTNDYLPVVSSAITAYDPLLDVDNKMLNTLSELIILIAEHRCEVNFLAV